MNMKLENNVIRINGYKDNKRTHVDITVNIKKDTTGWKTGRDIVFVTDSQICDLGFENGLDGVTSYNYYNYVADHRMTARIY